MINFIRIANPGVTVRCCCGACVSGCSPAGGGGRRQRVLAVRAPARLRVFADPASRRLRPVPHRGAGHLPHEDTRRTQALRRSGANDDLGLKSHLRLGRAAALIRVNFARHFCEFASWLISPKYNTYTFAVTFVATIFGAIVIELYHLFLCVRRWPFTLSDR